MNRPYSPGSPRVSEATTPREYTPDSHWSDSASEYEAYQSRNIAFSHPRHLQHSSNSVLMTPLHVVVDMQHDFNNNFDIIIENLPVVEIHFDEDIVLISIEQEEETDDSAADGEQDDHQDAEYPLGENETSHIFDEENSEIIYIVESSPVPESPVAEIFVDEMEWVGGIEA